MFLRVPVESSGGGSNGSHIRMLLNNSSVVYAPSVLPTNTPVLRAPRDISKRILSKCADGDIKAALRLLTSEDTVSEECEETLLALQSKNPPAPDGEELPLETLVPPSEALRVDTDNVLAAVNSMQSGSGAGLMV